MVAATEICWLRAFCTRLFLMIGILRFLLQMAIARVSEPACFGAAPAPGIFYPEPAPAPGEREHNVGIF